MTTCICNNSFPETNAFMSQLFDELIWCTIDPNTCTCGLLFSVTHFFFGQTLELIMIFIK